MLDRASIERLSRTPEKNAPLLNVALAEEGTAPVLLALARSTAVGPEALAVIGQRIEGEGDAVGKDPAAPAEEVVPIAGDLDRLLIAHPRAPDAVRDAVLARHPRDAFFVLAAACHPQATSAAIEARRGLALGLARARSALDSAPRHRRCPSLTLEEWSQDTSPLRREAAARIAHDPALLAALARDRSRQVRRAVASNRSAAGERARLASEDPAVEVRARAAGSSRPTPRPIATARAWWRRRASPRRCARWPGAACSRPTWSARSGRRRRSRSRRGDDRRAGAAAAGPARARRSGDRSRLRLGAIDEPRRRPRPPPQGAARRGRARTRPSSSTPRSSTTWSNRWPAPRRRRAGSRARRASRPGRPRGWRAARWWSASACSTIWRADRWRPSG